jgi:hypothetical protein
MTCSGREANKRGKIPSPVCCLTGTGNQHKDDVRVLRSADFEIISTGDAKLFELVRQRLAGGQLCQQMVEPAACSGLSLAAQQGATSCRAS